MNFPFTKCGVPSRQSSSPKAVLAHKLEGNEDKNVFSMTFNKYDDGHPAIIDDKPSLLLLDFQHLELSYFQQPLLRIIDYILEQLIPVCTEEYNLPNVMRVDPVAVAKRTSAPKFMEMKINLKNISVLLKATPSIKNYLRLRV